VPDADQRLSIAHLDLSSFPREISSYASTLKSLDASHNQLNSLRPLEDFHLLETLVLDSNQIEHNCVMPYLPNLKYLSVNTNRIANLDRFLGALRESCPSLHWLSLVNNVACPYFATGPPTSRGDYTEYRLQVLSTLQTLKVLDHAHVTVEERSRVAARRDIAKARKSSDATQESGWYNVETLTSPNTSDGWVSIATSPRLLPPPPPRESKCLKNVSFSSTAFQSYLDNNASPRRLQLSPLKAFRFPPKTDMVTSFSSEQLRYYLDDHMSSPSRSMTQSPSMKRFKKGIASHTASPCTTRQGWSLSSCATNFSVSTVDTAAEERLRLMLSPAVSPFKPRRGRRGRSTRRSLSVTPRKPETDLETANERIHLLEAKLAHFMKLYQGLEETVNGLQDKMGAVQGQAGDEVRGIALEWVDGAVAKGL
jgi:hypothetical protein